MDVYKFRKKLARYLRGRSNETETALIEALYRSYAVNEQDLGESESERIRQSVYGKVKAVVFKQSIIRLPLFRIAASLVIALSVSLLIWCISYRHKREFEQPHYYTIQTGTNDVKQVTLPDSSVIWLNAASRLRVPESFKGDLREVDLLDGEAFFDVKRNPQRPFRVNVAGLKVAVLGTSFNISAYQHLKNIKVAVATGEVGVTKGTRVLATLLPNQQLVYDRAAAGYSLQTVDAGHSQSWKQGDTYLTEAGFEELALAIKNIYGLSLKAGNGKVNDYLFSLRIQRGLPEDQVLKVISQIHNTHFRKEGNTVILY
jgi:transmembrane sensor